MSLPTTDQVKTIIKKTNGAANKAALAVAQAVDSDLQGYMPLSGGKFTGNVTGQYFTGTWLQTTTSGNLSSTPDKFCVLDNAGWIYYRTLDQMRSDVGPKSAKITLSASKWSQNKQSVSVSGVSADEAKQAIYICPAMANIDAFKRAGILCITQAEGSLTFQCDETPSDDLIVYVNMQNVS